MIKRPDYSQILLDEINALYGKEMQAITIPKDKEIYFLASGGKDSTAMILEAFRLGIKGTMLFKDTHYNSEGAIPTLERLKELTGFPLVTAKYEGKKAPGIILKESFLRIPDALDYMKETGRYSKKFFKCCQTFKERPANKYFKDKDHDRIIIVMGIKGGDGSDQRRMRLAQLRNKRTFFRKYKSTGLLYYYPLRDVSEKGISMILEEYGFSDIKATGCRMCPVFMVIDRMRNKDPKTWLRSRKFARTLGVKAPIMNQTELRDFCTGTDCDE